ncbi:tRNA-histidine guanylyltransferase 1 [Pelomyxa schiedti]|nr:tRNA-histidine guanylyltransferase 1 [Pelomyxa schiedti]
MANSKYEYVKQFEQSDRLVSNTFLVVRVDGKGFHKFTRDHSFVKPNDIKGLRLMNECAMRVMAEFSSDIVAAYGQSDEYSFLLKRSSQLYSRRASKIATYIVALFSSSYVFCWSNYFDTPKPQYPPTFDARVVCYPTVQNVRDYFSWRQADCHINNLYNTCFWSLVHSGLTPADAEHRLAGTVAADKNELLFSQFGINYAKLPQIFRKGSVIYYSKNEVVTDYTTWETRPVTHSKKRIVIGHEDIIGDSFWVSNPHVLSFEPISIVPSQSQPSPSKRTPKNKPHSQQAPTITKQPQAPPPPSPDTTTATTPANLDSQAQSQQLRPEGDATQSSTTTTSQSQSS